ncbi:ABC transporter ATP-binding protein [Blastococcus sp. TF02A-26]|uniref:ABC transporter ATP-binding protein n=1 Tax=Blastococcus sp. TF02A-26 TaxID=2250577 RepID=UPI000DEA6DEC|nr:ABC transporter ATP-binding protein [Blastococcus sp. TF02A-26]RBY82760.1 ABC transporter ATP-binding protein [Blastococcus sp. TF02A-26]
MSHDRARTDGLVPALELRGISKRYGPVVACDAVDLTVQRGEVHGLLGENGAGKSTLMKVLMGLVHADAGEVHRDGRRVEIDTPLQAAEHGLGMVHQHFSLIEPLTVWENVALGEPGRIDKDAVCADVEAVGKRYGLVVDPTRTVERLSAGERQRVELIKALRRDPRVLILDEPTSVLTIAESAALFDVLRTAVAAEGRGVILISHKLAEITAATDVVSVLRRGRLAFSCRTADTSAPELARQMVGRDVSLHAEGAALGLVVTDDPAKHLSPVLAGGLDAVPAEPPAPQVSADVQGTAALALHGLCVTGPDGRVLLDSLDLEVATGEIVALYGVEGNGQATLGDLLSGLLEPDAGTVRVDGTDVVLDRPGALHEAGVGVIPEDRHRSGVVLDMSVAENLVMTDLRRYSGRLLMRRAQVRAQAQELIERFAIRTPSIDAPLRTLSGGNQQRVVLARELSAGPTVLVAAQPTHGLDVGAIEDMYARLREAAASGVAVLLISTELEEVMALASRIAVISSGRITGVLDVAEASPQRLGMLVGGEAA